MLLTTLSSNCYTFCGVATFAGDTWTVDTARLTVAKVQSLERHPMTPILQLHQPKTLKAFKEKTLEDNRDSKKIRLTDTGDKNMQHFLELK